MNKTAFLTQVAEVMKTMISYEDMMASLQRSCMRAQDENLALMKAEEENVDRFIGGIAQIGRVATSESILDVLVLRYLKNTQFLANMKEDDIDISGIEGEGLGFWKKTMLYRAP